MVPLVAVVDPQMLFVAYDTVSAVSITAGSVWTATVGCRRLDPPEVHVEPYPVVRSFDLSTLGTTPFRVAPAAR